MTSAQRVSSFYQAKNYRLDSSVGYLAKQLAQTMSRVLDQRMLELGLTNAQWKPLLFLQQGACRTAADLARIACHDTGAITRLLDRLEEKGLIARVRSAQDRRVVHLQLTPEGARVAAEVPRIISECSNQVLRGFSRAEFTQFKDLLGRALSNARALSVAEFGAELADEAAP